jgi:hypothetical protein
VKTTTYFDFRIKFNDRSNIKTEWILRVVQNPLKTKIQYDGRIQMWARIEEFGNRWLRVVLLSDSETVHNAFWS